MGNFKVTLALLALLTASPGCALKHHPDGTGVAEGKAVEGHVGVELLPDADLRKPALSTQQLLMAPRPLQTPLPEYPQGRLAADAPPVTLVVRIIVEEDGTVHEVLPSPQGQATGDIALEPFRASVERAVKNWRFAPATVRTLAEGSDVDHDGKADYQVMVDEKPVRTYLDLRFKFEVVAGRGRVVAGPNQ